MFDFVFFYLILLFCFSLNVLEENCKGTGTVTYLQVKSCKGHYFKKALHLFTLKTFFITCNILLLFLTNVVYAKSQISYCKMFSKECITKMYLFFVNK